MIHIKDLLRLLLRNEAVGQAHARPLPLVPETAALDTVLADHAARAHADGHRASTSTAARPASSRSRTCSKRSSATSTTGPGSAPQPYRDGDGRLRVPGTMRLDELGQAFDLDLEHEDVDSVSGLVLTLLGRAPAVGDSVRYDRLQIEVTAVKGHGVEEAAVTLAEAVD